VSDVAVSATAVWVAPAGDTRPVRVR